MKEFNQRINCFKSAYTITRKSDFYYICIKSFDKDVFSILYRCESKGDINFICYIVFYLPVPLIQYNDEGVCVMYNMSSHATCRQHPATRT